MNREFELPDEKDNYRYPHDAYQLRPVIYTRDMGICKVCGASVEYEHYQLSHIVDRSRGGAVIASNVILCCWFCNNVKPKHNTREEFLDWMRAGAWITPFVERAKKEGLEIDEDYIITYRNIFANMGWNTKSEREPKERRVKTKDKAKETRQSTP